jgi:hypothetical protein
MGAGSDAAEGGTKVWHVGERSVHGTQSANEGSFNPESFAAASGLVEPEGTGVTGSAEGAGAGATGVEEQASKRARRAKPPAIARGLPRRDIFT